jgi:hypothetical protein
MSKTGRLWVKGMHAGCVPEMEEGGGDGRLMFRLLPGSS